ncbi:competence protein ComJ [Rhodoplanes sp. TEM]|uniref:Competence protein ComJ n=1 Tax=Rhodoplanes tepidamans TaxID=200616 RepID=A0ABT5JIY3_RHOTP|nr:MULTISPECIES: competence protein ComJ [Rhodoplanes]MDC7789669.1 competence protein ComJ [Rhodoplanes tepidamans]MDC7983854.1 competence protein ComJ [Rhodoplanes sp. TEM]MDQ0359137.1 hypothetical protein [Rhodoplanes tepidamans]
MSITSFELEVSYGQIAVICRGLTQPFNDWTERHVAQGFAWRPGSVSFRTLEEFGAHTIEVLVPNRADPIDGTVARAIEVPFEIPENGAVDIASIADAASLRLPAGPCLLRCEMTAKDDNTKPHVRFVFARMNAGRFGVVRADDGISAGDRYLTAAEPAGS